MSESHAARDDGPVERFIFDAYRLAAESLDRLVCDVGASGGVHDDQRLDYVTVQIDRDVWNRVREVVKHPAKTVQVTDG